MLPGVQEYDVHLASMRADVVILVKTQGKEHELYLALGRVEIVILSNDFGFARTIKPHGCGELSFA